MAITATPQPRGVVVTNNYNFFDKETEALVTNFCQKSFVWKCNFLT